MQGAVTECARAHGGISAAAAVEAPPPDRFQRGCAGQAPLERMDRPTGDGRLLLRRRVGAQAGRATTGRTAEQARTSARLPLQHSTQCALSALNGVPRRGGLGFGLHVLGHVRLRLGLSKTQHDWIICTRTIIFNGCHAIGSRRLRDRDSLQGRFTLASQIRADRPDVGDVTVHVDQINPHARALQRPMQEAGCGIAARLQGHQCVVAVGDAGSGGARGDGLCRLAFFDHAALDVGPAARNHFRVWVILACHSVRLYGLPSSRRGSAATGMTAEVVDVPQPSAPCWRLWRPTAPGSTGAAAVTVRTTARERAAWLWLDFSARCSSACATFLNRSALPEVIAHLPESNPELLPHVPNQVDVPEAPREA